MEVVISYLDYRNFVYLILRLQLDLRKQLERRLINIIIVVVSSQLVSNVDDWWRLRGSLVATTA